MALRCLRQQTSESSSGDLFFGVRNSIFLSEPLFGPVKKLPPPRMFKIDLGVIDFRRLRQQTSESSSGYLVFGARNSIFLSEPLYCPEKKLLPTRMFKIDLGVTDFRRLRQPTSESSSGYLFLGFEIQFSFLNHCISP